jgi:hypothetical protein
MSRSKKTGITNLKIQKIGNVEIHEGLWDGKPFKNYRSIFVNDSSQNSLIEAFKKFYNPSKKEIHWALQCLNNTNGYAVIWENAV